MPSKEDEAKKAAAAEAMLRRSKSKKKDNQTKYYIAGGLFAASTVFAIWLGMTNEGPRNAKSRAAASQDTALVNDASFIKGVTSDARGNFTAAASPYFNKWTYGDLKYGLDGVSVRGAGMIGMPGAIQMCER